jgi:anti-sigma factor ChrR (cupin superfamily)
VPSGDDPFILRSYEGTWAETGVQGVTFRQLFFDSESRRVTMLVRMAPGSVYPPHRHRSSEECLVLQGDLWVGNTMLRAGDHQRSEAGTLHGEQSSRGGCLLLVTASPDDEMHAP